MFKSSGDAPDGRAIVEVETCSYRSHVLTLAGTACAYEGNVILQMTNDQGHPQILFTQASASGPERGNWRIQTRVEQVPLDIRVGDEDPSAGRLFPASVVHLRVHADGTISEMAPHDKRR